MYFSKGKKKRHPLCIMFIINLSIEGARKFSSYLYYLQVLLINFGSHKLLHYIDFSDFQFIDNKKYNEPITLLIKLIK